MELAVGIIGIIVGITGAITATVALLQARNANKLAEQANSLAQVANDTAANANKVAEKANEISRDANTISRRSLAVTEDDTEYSWKPNLDHKNRLFVITNDCAHPALEVSVLVRNHRETVGQGRFNKVAAFSNCSFEAELLFNEYARELTQLDKVIIGDEEIVLEKVIVTVSVYIQWKTLTGTPRNHTIHARLG